MTPKSDTVYRRAGLAAALILTVLLALPGCSSAPKAPEAEKPEEQPPSSCLLAGGDCEKVLEAAKRILSRLGIECDPTLELKDGSDSVLGQYDFTTNVIFIPRDGGGEEFYRAVMYAVGATPSGMRDLSPNEERASQLGKFIHNVFLLHELGAYLRHQYKSFDSLNLFVEAEIAMEFARLIVDSLLAEEPESGSLLTEMVTFYEKLLARGRKQFSTAAQALLNKELRQWFDKTFAADTGVSQSERLVYKLARALAHFKVERSSSLEEFTRKYIFDPGAKENAGGLRIILADRSLAARTIYEGSRSVLRRVGHTHQLRGFSGVAADVAGRVFFSDYKGIRQVCDTGALDVVKGSQGIFAPTGFCVRAGGKFYFTDQDMVRVADVPGRKVANIQLGGKLGESSLVNAHAISPIAVTQAGEVLVVNNSNHTLYRIGSDGALLGSVAVKGVIGGIALHGDEVYMTNTSSHTVDRIDPGGTVASVAGVRNYPGHGDGKGFEVFFNSPTGICVNEDGVIFVADTYNHAIRAIATDGSVTTVVGLRRGNADGKVESAALHCPVGVAVDPDGNLYVAELAAERLVVISSGMKRPESKPIGATDLSGCESSDEKIAGLSKEIKNCAVGYRLFDTYVMRGIRYRQLGEHEKSIEDLQSAIGIGPERVCAYVEAGLTREAQGDLDAAIALYTLAINMKKDLSPKEQFQNRDLLRALMQRGAAQGALHNFESALKDLTYVIETRNTAVVASRQRDLPPKEVAEIWFIRGKIYLDSGDTKNAIKDLDRALRHDSKFARAYHCRGVAHKVLEEYGLAVDDLTRAASLTSGYADPHYVLGQIYQSNIVDDQKAIAHLTTYIALKGEHKADAQARIEEIRTRLDRTTVEDEPYTETIEEDAEGRRWRVRKYASGRVQKFPLKEEK